MIVRYRSHASLACLAILAAVAFALSMIADFTALPGALWMVFKDKPDALKTPADAKA